MSIFGLLLVIQQIIKRMQGSSHKTEIMLFSILILNHNSPLILLGFCQEVLCAVAKLET